ncbi:MAG: M20 family metallopeptidase [Candidatus Poribacteria bacterium]|nr:M20 family metallopeptidase [Candidatus Poribacteria bacterium]
MNDPWTFDSRPVIALLQEAVSIESVNPGLPGGSRGEEGMVAFIQRFFSECGIDTETDEVLPGRCNIVATLPGRDRSRALLFESHMDTASAEMMTIPPFEPHVRDGKLYGRGACDTKAGGAAMMLALRELKEEGCVPPCDIQFAGVADEEKGLAGASRLASATRANAVVVSEPTDLRVVRAHNGVCRLTLRVEGVSAHSSKPQLGVNAIVKAAGLIQRIETEMAPSVFSKTHPLTGGAALNIGVIRGGTQVNIVPHECVVEIDRRLIPGENAEEAEAPLRALVKEAARLDPDLRADLEPPFMMMEPFETAEESQIVQAAQSAREETLGRAETAGVPFGTDASKYAAAGIPAVVLGPGSIDQAHAAVEWVDCAQVEAAVNIYKTTAMRFR